MKKSKSSNKIVDAAKYAAGWTAAFLQNLFADELRDFGQILKNLSSLGIGGKDGNVDVIFCKWLSSKLFDGKEVEISNETNKLSAGGKQYSPKELVKHIEEKEPNGLADFKESLKTFAAEKVAKQRTDEANSKSIGIGNVATLNASTLNASTLNASTLNASLKGDKRRR